MNYENHSQQTNRPARYSAALRMALSTTVHAETNKLVIESGDSAQSRQHAAMEKEQWNDTRNLRQEVNKRTEKEWDKADAAFDNRDKCEQSANTNAYWEPKYFALPGPSNWPLSPLTCY